MSIQGGVRARRARQLGAPQDRPFAELRYGTEEARIVREAFGGRYDALLPALRDHVQKFSEAAF